jgi:hypothetical protein
MFSKNLCVSLRRLAGLIFALLVLGLCSFCHPSRSMQGFFPVSFAAEHDLEAEQVCIITVPEIQEASGIARSLHHENAVWIHNDSGDAPRLFLIDTSGKALAGLNVNVRDALDWEDMCSFELEGDRWLLVGDIGDNAHRRGKGTRLPQLLLLKEPRVQAMPAHEEAPLILHVDPTAVIEFQYPTGAADCESLAVDPERKEILLLTKTDPLNCRLYRLPLSVKPGHHRVEAELVTTIGVPYATAMDISPDGHQLAIVNMFSGALMRRGPNESWQDACQKPAIVLTLPARPQGETVCFERDARSLLLNSEGKNQPLWRVPLPVSVD